MVVLYTIIGLVFILAADLNLLPVFYQRVLGIIIIIYAAFRLWKVIKFFRTPEA
ncbi:MAG: hypothetical protein ACHQNT_03815 [Bacteroidia bacterium]